MFPSARTIGTLLIAVTALCACGQPVQTPGPSGASGENATTVASPPDVDAARQAIEGADLANDDSISALEAIRFTPAGEEAARDALISGASGTALWAATWVYASSAKDPAPLRPLLDNPDASVRVMAAAGAVAMGERAGFAPLATALSDLDRLKGSRPPLSIAAFAATTLIRSVAASGAPAPPQAGDTAEAVAARWSAWLDQHANALQFDQATRTWKLP